jgi:PST family polysaccharide transporter
MEGSLKQSVPRALTWGLASTITMRLGGLVVGIVLARLLTPEQFGVYAVALTVQTVLQMLAGLGLGAALIRAEDPERMAPTVATLALISGAVLCGAMALCAGPAADLIGVPDAASVIAVLSLTMLLTGVAVVPFTLLNRNFEQKKLFAASGVDFVIGTVVSILLVVIGMGPMALAISRLVAQSCSTAMVFVLSKWRPRFGFDRSEAGPALRFGLQAASACLLSVVLINIDNVVIARVAGQAALGFYVLAFNVSNWPMSALGQGIKFVSLAAFSESARRRTSGGITDRDPGLAVGVTFAWAAAVPAGISLGVLSVPLIRVLYGDRWLPSAAVLAALGMFGALRVVFMLFDDYLLAHGNARIVMWLQVLWIAALTPAMVVGTRDFGIAGGGWSHVIVSVVIMLPAYLLAVGIAGADALAVVRALIPPMLAMVPCWFAAYWVSAYFDTPVLALIFGGGTAVLLYVRLIHRWIIRIWQSVNQGEAAPARGGLS